MHPEVEELQPKLKEILYDCAVEIRATKAALYLFDGTSRFELVTEYGFRGTQRRSADVNDPLIDRCGRARTPFFINGVGTEPRFSEMLFEASTDRLLAAPLYSRGKLIGLIDMRDKAGKQPFDQNDVPRAQGIADRLVELVAEKNIFGHRFITLSNMSGQMPGAMPEERPAPSPRPAAATPASTPAGAPPTPQPAAVPQPAPPAASPGVRMHVPRLATLVIEARSIASRISPDPIPETLRESDLAAARDVLRAILLIPGAAAATLSAFGHLGGVQEMAGRSTVSDEARNLIQSKLHAWLAKRGEPAGSLRTTLSAPFGTSGPVVGAADVQKVFTAPLVVGSMRGLYLTVAFSGNPDRVAHELMAVMHANMQSVLDHASLDRSFNALQTRVAEKLVEPDFARYVELRRHTLAVASLAEEFAGHLMLSAREVENARLVALVHDCGMRLLDYERLYRKRDLTPEEIGFLREHPSVGAALVEPLLGPEIARAVLCHHERVDGAGYPNQLQGNEIPLLSRIVQICDAWVAMTDPEGYQPAEAADSAMVIIRRAGGTQFDAELSGRFVDMLANRNRGAHD